MATGPAHYSAAELLLAAVDTGEGGHVIAMEQLAAAQVHATLALAAATVNAAPVEEPSDGMPQLMAKAWQREFYPAPNGDND